MKYLSHAKGKATARRIPLTSWILFCSVEICPPVVSPRERHLRLFILELEARQVGQVHYTDMEPNLHRTTKVTTTWTPAAIWIPMVKRQLPGHTPEDLLVINCNKVSFCSLLLFSLSTPMGDPCNSECALESSPCDRTRQSWRAKM